MRIGYDTKLVPPAAMQQVLSRIDGWQVNQPAVNKAVSDALSGLGGPIMDTIMWHLRSRGIFLDPEHDIDVRVLHEHLEQLLGHGADMVIIQIHDKLRRGGQMN